MSSASEVIHQATLTDVHTVLVYILGIMITGITITLLYFTYRFFNSFFK